MVDAATAAAATQDTGAKIDTSRARLADNFETFLALLTTQLKNQDPLSPMDSNQFTQQIVQMTGVEQQLLTNDLLKKLLDTTGKGIAEAVSLIGKEVTAPNATSTIKNGQAKWTYDLDEAANEVKLEVLDASGRMLHSESLTSTAKGEHSLTWNGKDLAGKQLPDGGTYTLQVTAKDAAGKAIDSRVLAKGVVTAVEQVDGETLITVGTAKIPWASVISITQPHDDDEDTETAGDETPPATQG